MEKTLKLLQYTLLIFCFIGGAVYAQVEKVIPGPSIEKMLNDPRYDTAFSMVGEQNLFLDINSAIPKETDTDFAVLVPIIDAMNEPKGVLSVHQGTWYLSMETNNEIVAFKLIMNGQSVTPIKLSPPDHPEEEGLKEMVFNGHKPKSLTKVYMVGNDWCMYTSKLSIHYSCWSPNNNPLAYYFIVKYRKGDPINSNHYTWRNDYKGRGIACPLDEHTVFNMPQCGFPPD